MGFLEDAIVNADTFTRVIPGVIKAIEETNQKFNAIGNNADRFVRTLSEIQRIDQSVRRYSASPVGASNLTLFGPTGTPINGPSGSRPGVQTTADVVVDPDGTIRIGSGGGGGGGGINLGQSAFDPKAVGRAMTEAIRTTTPIRPSVGQLRIERAINDLTDVVRTSASQGDGGALARARGGIG